MRVTQGEIIDGNPGIERQIELNAQLLPMIVRRDAIIAQIRQLIERIPWLEESMGSLGEHMMRNAFIYKDDVPTFPVDMERNSK